MKNLLFMFITWLLLTGKASAISRNIFEIRNSTPLSCEDQNKSLTLPFLLIHRVLAQTQPSLQRTCKDSAPQGTTHVLHLRWAFVNADTNGAEWQFQGDIFRVWDTPQDSTFPFYRLNNPANTDYVFVISTTGSPPVVSGFSSPAIIGYVYSSQICGSVPLYSVFWQSAASDHWYTTSTSERDKLVASGWIDSGIAAYVLPLSSALNHLA